MPHGADIEILLLDLSEAVTPQTISQFWPPNSLDCRSELILPVCVVNDYVDIMFGYLIAHNFFFFAIHIITKFKVLE